MYDAVDTRLDRAVAVKVLRPELADAPDRRARFVVSTAADTVVPITVVLNWEALLEK